MSGNEDWADASYEKSTEEVNSIEKLRDMAEAWEESITSEDAKIRMVANFVRGVSGKDINSEQARRVAEEVVRGDE